MDPIYSSKRFKRIYPIVIITIVFLGGITACKNNYAEDDEYADNEVSSQYPDGKYCAAVRYYNPGTGSLSEYELRVEIENHELVTIFWPNGGWLDATHFDPPDISDGHATFESDKGYEYEVDIIGPESDCETAASEEDENDEVNQQ